MSPRLIILAAVALVLVLLTSPVEKLLGDSAYAFESPLHGLVAGLFIFQGVSFVGATLTGKVAFEGPAPEPKPINFGAEKQCAMMHGDKMPQSEDIVDPVLHNVRSASKKNKAFNIAQPIQGMETSKVLDQPEIGIQLRCDVHFWMVSYLHVLDNPYFVVTGEDGAFVWKGIPAGTYTVEVWHEKLGTQTAQITVGEDDDKVSDFVFKRP